MIERKKLSPLFSNKKGNILIIGLLMFFVAGLIFLLIVMGTQHYLLGEVNTMVQDSDFSDTAKNSISDLESKNNIAWDNAFAFLLGGILVGCFMAGFTLQNNPLIMGVVLLLVLFAAYAGMHIVNVYEDIAADTTDTINFRVEFPKANFIMSNLVAAIIAGVTLIGLGIFTSNRIGL